MPTNIIDSIQLSGVTYTLQGSGGGTVSSAITSGDTNAVAGGAVYDKFDEVEQVTARALNDLDEKINPTVELTQAEYDALVSAGTVSADTYYIITDATPVDVSQYWTSAQTQSAINQATSGKVNTSSVVSSVTSASTDSQIPTAKAVWEAASGGGKAISAGTNISVTTGETADTVSCTLPIIEVHDRSDTRNIIIPTDVDIYGNLINGNTLTNSRTSWNLVKGRFNKLGSYYVQASKNNIFGNNNTIEGNLGKKCENNFVVGDYNFFGGQFSDYAVSKSAVFGDYLYPKNNYEYVFGKYNNSVSASTTFGDSGNTLFSVGNGTAENARHNAFEIRQNGDIYITSGSTDIKLQDYLGGTASSAITSGDTNAVAGGAVYDKFDEIEQVTAASLNALNDKFGGLKLVKLTQAEYNALTTKDSSTLYIIVN